MRKCIFIFVIIMFFSSCSKSDIVPPFDGGISYEGENMTFSHTPTIGFYQGQGIDFVNCIENDSVFYADIVIQSPSDYSDSYKEKRPEIEFKFIMHSLPEKDKKYKLVSLPYMRIGDSNENWNTSMPDVIGVAMTDRYPIKGLNLTDSIDRNKASKVGFLSRKITNGWVSFDKIESSEVDNYYPDGTSQRSHLFKITYGFDAKMHMLADSEIIRNIHVEGWFNINRNQRDKKLFFFSTDSMINWYLNDFYGEDGTAL